MTAISETETLMRTVLQAHIVQALRTVPEAMDELVKAALGKQVDPFNGSSESSRYGTKMVPYLDYLVGREIRKAAEEAVSEAVSERVLDIKAAIKRQMSADAMVDAMAAMMLGTLGQEYRVQIKFASDTDR